MSKMLRFFLNPRWRFALFALLSVCLQLCLWLISPEQAPVILYKLGLPLLAAILGVFFDAAVFPYARPSSYLNEDWTDKPTRECQGKADHSIAMNYLAVFSMACLRRAIIVAAFVIAVSLGL